METTPINKKGQFGAIGAGMVTGIIFLVMALIIGLVVYSKFMGSMNDSFTANGTGHGTTETRDLFNDIRGYAIIGFALLALGILVAVGAFIMGMFGSR